MFCRPCLWTSQTTRPGVHLHFTGNEMEVWTGNSAGKITQEVDDRAEMQPMWAPTPSITLSAQVHNKGRGNPPPWRSPPSLPALPSPTLCPQHSPAEGPV